MPGDLPWAGPGHPSPPPPHEPAHPHRPAATGSSGDRLEMHQAVPGRVGMVPGGAGEELALQVAADLDGGNEPPAGPVDERDHLIASGVEADATPPDEVVEAEQPFPLAHEEVCRLDHERVAGAAAVVLQVEAALGVGGRDPGPALWLHLPVVDPVGQADEVAGEAVAAEVGALPEVLAERGLERGGQPAAALGAAEIVPPVG